MNESSSQVSGRVEGQQSEPDRSYAKTLWTYGKNADLVEVEAFASTSTRCRDQVLRWR